MGSASHQVGGLREVQVHNVFFLFVLFFLQRKLWKETATPKKYKQSGL